jgi:hypothetical protein
LPGTITRPSVRHNYWRLKFKGTCMVVHGALSLTLRQDTIVAVVFIDEAAGHLHPRDQDTKITRIVSTTRALPQVT